MMDLETENRIAAILMKEAAELRRQAEQEGALAYLKKPSVRARPNSRFLTATVLGVQQANKAVEVNEMWRLRHKELELDNRIKRRSSDQSSSRRHHKDAGSSRSADNRNGTVDYSGGPSCSSSNHGRESCHTGGDDGLSDEEIEQFLLSRVKRGRGAIGSRMDETGPYLLPCTDTEERRSISPELRKQKVVYGPEKPSSLVSLASEENGHEDRHKKSKVRSKSSRKHSSKHRSEKKHKHKKRDRSKRND